MSEDKCECGGELARVHVWICPKCGRRYVTTLKKLRNTRCNGNGNIRR